MSCLHTFAQNDKVERILRSINNAIRSLLFQAYLPPRFWATTLGTATYLLNILPIKTLAFTTPHLVLSASHRHMSIFAFSVVHATPISPPQPPINLPHALPFVSSLATPLITRATFVSIVHPTTSSSRATWSSMKPHVPSPRIPLHPRVQHLISWTIQLTQSQFHLDCHMFPFFQVTLPAPVLLLHWPWSGSPLSTPCQQGALYQPAPRYLPPSLGLGLSRLLPPILNIPLPATPLFDGLSKLLALVPRPLSPTTPRVSGLSMALPPVSGFLEHPTPYHPGSSRPLPLVPDMPQTQVISAVRSTFVVPRPLLQFLHRHS
jgi:hypothetical protein